MLMMVYFLCLYTPAQNIAINANGAAPDASAMLDVQSTNKGVLIPREILIGFNAGQEKTFE